MGKKRPARQLFENLEIHSGSRICPLRRGPRERYERRIILSEHWENLEFVNCKFVGNSLMTRGSVAHRSTATNVRFTNCSVNYFVASGAVFDDVVLDGLKTSVHPCLLSGCCFRQVVLKGKCGGFLIRPGHENWTNKGPLPEFAAANAAFYKKVTWALDITQLQASCLELHCSIPVDLIRRNPEEHVIMSREVAASKIWKKHKPPDSFQFGVSTFLSLDADEEMFIACKRSKAYAEDMAFFSRLRAKGLVR